MNKLFIYIAGPYTYPDPCVNTNHAIHAGQAIMDAGHVPFVPHLNHLWHTVIPNPYETWMAYDHDWISKCDMMLRIPGKSLGADRDVQRANELGIPVHICTADDFLKMIQEQTDAED